MKQRSWHRTPFSPDTAGAWRRAGCEPAMNGMLDWLLGAHREDDLAHRQPTLILYASPPASWREVAPLVHWRQKVTRLSAKGHEADRRDLAPKALRLNRDAGGADCQGSDAGGPGFWSSRWGTGSQASPRPGKGRLPGFADDPQSRADGGHLCPNNLGSSDACGCLCNQREATEDLAASSQRRRPPACVPSTDGSSMPSAASLGRERPACDPGEKCGEAPPWALGPRCEGRAPVRRSEPVRETGQDDGDPGPSPCMPAGLLRMAPAERLPQLFDARLVGAKRSQAKVPRSRSNP